jgi:hypothetical protein
MSDICVTHSESLVDEGELVGLETLTMTAMPEHELLHPYHRQRHPYHCRHCHFGGHCSGIEWLTRNDAEPIDDQRHLLLGVALCG